MTEMLLSKKITAFLALALFLGLAALRAEAHAKLVGSQPADGAVLPEPPKTIELVFSEELQKVSMNSIAVTDRSGARVGGSVVMVSEDGKRMWIDFSGLSTGSYTVEWRALSADDHTMKGKFLFEVSPPETKAAGPVEQTPPRNAPNMRMDHQMPAQEASTNWAQSVVRWLMYLAMMTLFGGFAFRLFVLKPALAGAPNLDSAERIAAFANGESSFARLILLSSAVLASAAVAALLLQTASVFDLGITQAAAPERLFQVLTETSYGAPWFLQAAVVVGLFALGIFFTRRNRNAEAEQGEPGTATAAMWIGLTLSALLFLTPSLTGHARAAVREYPLAVVADWLHLIAGGIWVGGLFHLVLTVPGSLKHLAGFGRLCVLSRVIPLFSRVAVAATVVMTLTGLYSSWIHVESFSALLSTPYGQVLILKIVHFLPMLVLGGLNTFVLLPRTERLLDEAASSARHEATDGRFFRAVRIEAALGAIVLLLAAILAFLPPARQHEMPMSGDVGCSRAARKI